MSTKELVERNKRGEILYSESMGMDGLPFHRSGPVDLDGNPVRRTKHEWPYSYDAFVVWRGGDNSQITSSVYSDRMMQWNMEKFNAGLERFFKGPNQRGWSQQDPKVIEEFLRFYFDDPALQLIVLMEGCNVSNGYPYWVFCFKGTK